MKISMIANVALLYLSWPWPLLLSPHDHGYYQQLIDALELEQQDDSGI